MRRMMQSMVRQFEYHKFNALLILLTFLSHEQYHRAFGITVDPLDSLPTSTIPTYSERFADSSEVHDLNNIDYNQFSGPNSYAGSSEPVSKNQASVKCALCSVNKAKRTKNVAEIEFVAFQNVFVSKGIYWMQNHSIRDSGDNLLPIMTHASLTFCLKCMIQFSCYQCQTHSISSIQENRHIAFYYGIYQKRVHLYIVPFH